MRNRTGVAVAAALVLFFAMPAEAAELKAPTRTVQKAAKAAITAPAKHTTKKKQARKPTTASRRLDGVRVPAGKANLWPVAVMIDNMTLARPQAGLNEASVVYEALAEGGIPRFMAVFGKRTMTLVGPVRSARPYFLRYAAEYPAAMVHAGGSPDAQTLLRDLRLVNIEAVTGKTAKYFFRTRPGNSVHDLFTSGTLLNKAMQQTSVRTLRPHYRPWKYVNDPPVKKRGEPGHGASVNIGAGRNYDIRYEFDRKSNAYLRFTGSQPHLDRVTKQQLSAKTVILQLVPKERVLDSKGRLDIQNTGKGKAVMLQSGRAMTVRWEKKSDRDRTIFRTSAGQEITFPRGSVWITMVPRGHRYTIF